MGGKGNGMNWWLGQPRHCQLVVAVQWARCTPFMQFLRDHILPRCLIHLLRPPLVPHSTPCRKTGVQFDLGTHPDRRFQIARITSTLTMSSHFAMRGALFAVSVRFEMQSSSAAIPGARAELPSLLGGLAGVTQIQALSPIGGQ